MMFIHYTKKHKTLWILSKLSVIVGIIASLYAAMVLGKIQLPTIESKLSFGIGVIIVIGVGAMAFLNRLKMLFRVKSVGFLVAFIVLLCFSMALPALIWSVGLVSIPLVIDDLVIETYFKYLNNTQYWNIYKDKRKVSISKE